MVVKKRHARDKSHSNSDELFSISPPVWSHPDLAINTYKVGEPNATKGYDLYYTLSILANDRFIQMPLAKGWLFDKNNVIAAYSYLQPGAVVLDVGANIGTVALPLANAVKGGEGGGKVYAFEPQQVVSELLKRNVIGNGLEEIVTPVQTALGHRDDENVTMGATYFCPMNKAVVEVDYKSPDKVDSGGVALGAGGERVSMLTLDTFVAREELQRADLLKIDVEGAEPLVLLGAKETLTKFKPVLLIERNDVRLDEKALEALGVSQEEIDFDYLSFLSDIGYNTVIELPKGNYMFVPDDKASLPAGINDSKFKIKSTRALSDTFLDRAASGWSKMEFVKPRW